MLVPIVSLLYHVLCVNYWLVRVPVAFLGFAQGEWCRRKFCPPYKLSTGHFVLGKLFPGHFVLGYIIPHRHRVLGSSVTAGCACG